MPGTGTGVPLYGCRDCGWATTGSLANAVLAHDIGCPECAGEIELIADFQRPLRALDDGEPDRQHTLGADRQHGQAAAAAVE